MQLPMIALGLMSDCVIIASAEGLRNMQDCISLRLV